MHSSPLATHAVSICSVPPAGHYLYFYTAGLLSMSPSILSVLCQLCVFIPPIPPTHPPPAPASYAPQTSADGDIQLIDTQLIDTIYWRSNTAANRTKPMWLCLDDYGPLGLEDGSRVYWRANWDSSAGTPYRFYIQVSGTVAGTLAPCTHLEV